MAPILTDSGIEYEPKRPKSVRPAMILIGIFLLLIVSIAGTLYQRFTNRPPMNFQFTAPVKTALAETRALPSVYQTVGTLEANHQVNLKSEIPGVVKTLYVEEGQWVRQGDPVIQLEYDKQSAEVLEAQSASEETKAALSSMEADYQTRIEALKSAESRKKLAETEYTRYKNLLEKDFVTAQEVDQRKTQLEVEQANYASALKQRDSALAKLHQAKASIEVAKARQQRTQSNYADTLIRAPFAGRIGVKRVDVGDYVLPSQVMFSLVQADPIKIAFSVPERYLGKLKSRLSVDLATESQPDEAFTGKVIFVDPVVAPETRSVTVKALVDNRENRLQSGQYANVKLVLGQKENAVLVPEESLIPQGERYFVYVAKEGKAMFRPVTIGDRTLGWVEVLSGIRSGERVIVGGIQKLTDGAPIKDESLSKPRETR